MAKTKSAPKRSSRARSTVNPDEIAQFQQDSARWWDENGPFAPLHALNPLRMEFMVEVLEKQGIISSSAGIRPSGLTRGSRDGRKGPPAFAEGLVRKPDGPRLLDVGCGGGLVAEPFARLGARVVGIDGDAQAVRVARDHAAEIELAVDYRVGAVEDLKDDQFDVVTALEIIEHVDHAEVFVTEVARRVREGGIIFISTLNRTLKSLVLGKVVAEYVLGWVPPGTHDPRQFIKPSELAAMMADAGCTPVAATGLCYNVMAQKFYRDPHDLSVNYIMAFVKNAKSR
jgi:2-polyprenyl-6-hydroxyphenyl methylase/3-demethylubiquinone-9 3-methyltransferase